MKESTKSVFNQLLSSGHAINDIYKDSQESDGTLDWGKFTDAVHRSDMMDTILGLDTGDINQALAEVRVERRRLRDEWREKTMPGEIIERLSYLSDIGIELVDARLDVGLTPTYVDWLMEKAVPILKKAAPLLLART